MGSRRPRNCGESYVIDHRLPITDFAHKAGVVGDARERTVFAALDVSAERSRAAVLDRRHDFQLAEADMAGVGLAPRRAMGSKDVGDPRAVTRGPRHAAKVSRTAMP